MSAAELSALAGLVISLLFSYIPGLNTWFAGKSTEVKRVVMLVVLLVTSAGLYGISCAGWFGTIVTCDQEGIIRLVRAFVAAIIANQAIYSISPEPNAVREAKAERLPY